MCSTFALIIFYPYKTKPVKKHYELEGMNCSSGVNNVKWALLQLPEVQEADVQLNPQRVILTTSKALDIAELQAHIGRSGEYTIKEIIS